MNRDKAPSQEGAFSCPRIGRSADSALINQEDGALLGAVSKENQHGGARAGAGRKPITPGEKVVSGTISMPADAWESLDTARGEESRSGFLARLIAKLRG
jgi:hypothetical protein|tara:strand:- start:645 stop:944 length:300 start_codon:yes stop_codon:yes gene_type:complete